MSMKLSPVYQDLQPKFNETVEYIEFMFKLLGIDLEFNTFKEMNEGERLAFTRQHIIKGIIE